MGKAAIPVLKAYPYLQAVRLLQIVNVSLRKEAGSIQQNSNKQKKLYGTIIFDDVKIKVNTLLPEFRCAVRGWRKLPVLQSR